MFKTQAYINVFFFFPFKNMINMPKKMFLNSHVHMSACFIWFLFNLNSKRSITKIHVQKWDEKIFSDMIIIYF